VTDDGVVTDDGKSGDRLRELDFEVFSGDAGLRLDNFLNKRMAWRSRSSIQKLIATHQVRLKSRSCAMKPSLRVKGGDVVAVRIPVPKRELDGTLAGLLNRQIETLYEDRWILVVNKPAGIPVHPAGRILTGTVITLLRERCEELDGLNPEDVKLCHRLDLETSGVLLVSKDPVSMPSFATQFEYRKVSKEYLAIVHGEVAQDEGEIELPIGPATNSPIFNKRAIRRGKGQYARTGFKVEQRYEGFSRVRLKLYTGRHHQIRVHLSAIGHPIVGDKLYGLDENFFLMYFDGSLDEEAMKRLLLPRQALHACRLGLHHRGLGKEVFFEAPLPEDLTEFVLGLKKL
jgi:23S rRNA pseudouridine1911/1915/1917 synthase